MDAQAREDFRSYVAARSPALLRTAYMLTGNRADAEDLLQTALAKAYLAWDRIREREAADGYVRRVMVTTPEASSITYGTDGSDEATVGGLQPGVAVAPLDRDLATDFYRVFADGTEIGALDDPIVEGEVPDFQNAG